MQKPLYLWGLLLLAFLGLALAPIYGQNNPFSAKMKTKPAQANFDPGFQVKQIRGAAVARHIKPAAYQSLPYAQTGFKAENRTIIDLKRAGQDGLPISVVSQYPSLAKQAAYSESQIKEAAISYLSSIKTDLRIVSPEEEFVAKELRLDDQGYTHVRLQQVYQGIPVYGSEVMVHFSPDDQVRFAGRYQQTPHLTDLTPDVSIADARATVLADVAEHAIVHELAQRWKDFYDYEEPQAELVLFRPQNGSIGPHRLAWYVTVRPNLLQRWEYVLDAETGEVIQHVSSHCSVTPDTGTGVDLNGVLQNLNISNISGSYRLWDVSKDMYNDANNNGQPDDGEGFILTLDMNNDQPGQNANVTYISSNNKNSWDAAGVSAHSSAGICYDYFRTTHQRQSINGQGGDIISIINVADPQGSTAQPLDNAFWSGGLMYYGAGAQSFTHLAGALDVAAHEMSHGVIEATANLEYQGQSGALNESFADIFGIMIDRDDWKLGEDIVKPAAFPGGIGLRDVSDPHQGGTGLSSPGWQPRHMNEFWPDPNNQDHGGVHVNSGITNYAFYLFASASGMNKDKAEDIYYAALQNLTRSSQFIDCRIEVIAAANQLYGSSEANAAGTAFDQVGILDAGGGGGGGGGGTEYQVDLPPNTGTGFFASYNLDDLSATTIQTTGDFNVASSQLSVTASKTKISITDDGSLGFFVGEDNHIYYINMNTNNPQEIQLSNNPDWGNLAISKDGRLLAAVTNEVDTSIFVFDLAANPIVGWQFFLYNPTTAQNTNNNGGVLYADALAWDHCGEFLMYDAFTRIPNTSPGAPDIEYWDVNFLRVWDQEADQVGDGLVIKLFTNLPEGVSVGNAVFSKNSPYIIAYDELTSAANTIKAANIETGDIGTIWDNSTEILGYPDFDNSDEYITFNAVDTYDEPWIAAAKVLGDKITLDMNTGGYNPFLLLESAEWGVSYAQGVRDLSTACERVNENPAAIDPALLAGEILVFPNPFTEQVSVTARFTQATDVRLSLYDLLGKERWKSGHIQVHAGDFKQDISVRELAAGTYLLKIEANGQSEMRKIMKQ